MGGGSRNAPRVESWYNLTVCMVSDFIIGGQGVRTPEETPVSVGYDRVRFTAAVFLGDTITVEYVIRKIELERRRSYADIRITNQDGDLVCVATHILQWVKNT